MEIGLQIIRQVHGNVFGKSAAQHRTHLQKLSENRENKPQGPKISPLGNEGHLSPE